MDLHRREYHPGQRAYWELVDMIYRLRIADMQVTGYGMKRYFLSYLIGYQEYLKEKNKIRFQKK